MQLRCKSVNLRAGQGCFIQNLHLTLPTMHKSFIDGCSFAAIDFETADSQLDSACAVGVVRVDDGMIHEKFSRLIKPPRKSFRYTSLHGISWKDVREEPTFAEVWNEVKFILDGVEMLVAHNAAFDRSVLHTCLFANGLRAPDIPFLCTMRIARRTWRIYPTNLPEVCRRLDIALVHHDPLSDAEACARIMIAAQDSIKKRKGR